MEGKEENLTSKKTDGVQANRRQNVQSDEVLNLDELFGVQGGLDDDEARKHQEENCGLGCYGRNINNGGNEKG